MAEDITRRERLPEQGKEAGPLPEGKKPLAGKVVGAFRAVRGLFAGPPAQKGGPPAGIEKPPAFSARRPDLKSVNRILMVILAGLVVLTVYVAFRRRPDIASVTAAVSRIKFQKAEAGEPAAFQPLPFYLDQIKTRDIFNPFEEAKAPVQPVEPPPPPPPPPKVTIQEKARNLKLIGISWGDTRRAIIRDERTQEVHFLREGDTIKGTEIGVKKILKTEVILSSDGDEMSML